MSVPTFVEHVVASPGEYKMKTVCDGLAALNKVGIDLKK